MSNPREDAVTKAERLGLVLVKPKPNELFVDLDSPTDLAAFLCRLERFKTVGGFSDATVEYTTSISGHHHAYVTVPRKQFSDAQRIALQATLGSDYFREMIAIDHMGEGYEHLSVFFEKPDSIRRDTP